MESIQVQEMSGGELLNQEIQQIQETNEAAESIDLAVLRLNSDDHHHHHSHSSHSPCQSCGCSGGPSSSRNNKRRSSDAGSFSTPPLPPAAAGMENPERDSRFQLAKRPKKLFSESSPETLSGVVIPPGFSKIALPLSAQSISPPPAGSPALVAAVSPNLRCGSSQNLIPQSPATSNVVPNDSPTPSSKAPGSASRPPLPPLRRSWSLPSPDKPAPSTSSDAVSGNPPHHEEKLKAVGNWIKEVAKWWDEFHTVDEMPVVVDQAEKKVPDDDDNASNAVKDDKESAGCEESVNVERTGECLIINFKCPCKKGYQILLSGTSCYYKLM
ncbi:unnamed protein product [Linum tenue]|uniref:Uncharacterized protein n=1 Tax=Linum tenue TaxID=586396 RepID=A0AAV0K0M5_9ROSI|nr:unnamed protein product [Linum tenue]